MWISKGFTFTHRHLCLVRLFNCWLMQMSNQPITWQQINVFRHIDIVIVEVQTRNQNGEERWFTWFWIWHCCCGQTGYLCISKTADLLGPFFPLHNYLWDIQRMVQKGQNIQWVAVPCWCQRRTVRLLWADKKVKVQ